MCPQGSIAWLFCCLNLGTVPGTELMPSWPKKYELNLNYIQSNILPVGDEDCPSQFWSKNKGISQTA